MYNCHLRIQYFSTSYRGAKIMWYRQQSTTPIHQAFQRNSGALQYVVWVVIAVLGCNTLYGEEPPSVSPGVVPVPTTNHPPSSVSKTLTTNARNYFLEKDSFLLSAVEDDAPIRSESENSLEFDAYNQVILKAHEFTVDELESVARKDVTFKDLVKPIRADFRYDLIGFEGRLLQLRRMEPTKPLKEAGVKDLYEAWLFPVDGIDPMCVILTELPAGLEPSLRYNPPKRVRVAGYFFKLMWYESSQPDPKDLTRGRYRKAPLLMAKSLRLLPQPSSDAGEAWRTEFLPAMLGLFLLVTGLAFMLNWYFKRGDRRLQSEREARLERANPFSDNTSVHPYDPYAERWESP